MQLAHLLRNSGLAAIAATLAISAIATPAAAQDERQRGNRGGDREEESERAERAERPANRGEQFEQRATAQREAASNPAPVRDARQEARQVDRSSERQATRVEEQGDRTARRLENNGDNVAARQVDRNSEYRARQIEQRGDQRARETVREARRETVQDRARGDERGTTVVRNSSYADRGRNQSYRDNDRAGDRDQARNDDNRNRGNWNRDNNRDRGDWNRDNNRVERGRDQRRWDRNDWRRDTRYNWSHYRSSNRNTYRLGRYYSPYSSYNYRRLSIGYALDSLFFGSRYWINDPWQYRLPAVYGDYRWVRYYDDVLLVDTYTGEVVDVIYDFFW